MHYVDKKEQFHYKLKIKMDRYVYLVYQATKTFPDDEKFGVTSQLRRATLSVILNYIEGYARLKPDSRELCKFLEISYASFKESKYLLFFSKCEGYIKSDDYAKIIELADEIGAMLWSIIDNIKNKSK